MPSDSQFAVAMKNQQEAERAEQQRIKNLVLNYDLQDSGADSGTGSTDLLSDPFSYPNPNLRAPWPSRTFPSLVPQDIDEIQRAHTIVYKGTGAGEKHQHNASLHQNSAHHATNARPLDKSSSNRSGQRARKLQLSDVDWYDHSKNFPSNSLTMSLPQGRHYGRNSHRGSSPGRFRDSRGLLG